MNSTNGTQKKRSEQEKLRKACAGFAKTPETQYIFNLYNTISKLGWWWEGLGSQRNQEIKSMEESGILTGREDFRMSRKNENPLPLQAPAIPKLLQSVLSTHKGVVH